MKLYHGGFRGITAFVAAETEQEAITKVGEKLNMAYLPVEVQEISEVDGYNVDLVGNEPEKVEEKPKKPPSWRKK